MLKRQARGRESSGCREVRESEHPLSPRDHLSIRTTRVRFSNYNRTTTFHCAPGLRDFLFLRCSILLDYNQTSHLSSRPSSTASYRAPPPPRLLRIHPRLAATLCNKHTLLSKPSQPDSAMAQTPQQRLANERFAKSEAAKRGKPAPVVKKQEVQKAPISKGWVVLLAFVVCGGLVFELLRLFF
ncbi:hypothetical protein HDK64DRAFT_259777 [Phyllosticta capitalensis]